MADIFERGGDITTMDELKEAVRRDPVGAAIIIRDTQAEVERLMAEVERLREEIRLTLMYGTIDYDRLAKALGTDDAS